MAGPPMATVVRSVAMITSQQATSAVLPAKVRPLITVTSGTRPESWEKRVNVCVSKATPGAAAVVAGPAAAAFAEQDERDAEAMRQLEHAILLVVVAPALRAGQHGVVVVDEHGARRFVAEQIRVHGADAGDQAVCRRVLAQRFP